MDHAGCPAVDSFKGVNIFPSEVRVPYRRAVLHLGVNQGSVGEGPGRFGAVMEVTSN